MEQFYAEHRKKIYLASILTSLSVDVALLLLPDVNPADKLANRALITFCAQLAFGLVNFLDRESTVYALSQNFFTVEQHPELTDLSDDRDPKVIRQKLDQINPELIRFTHPVTQDALIFRERKVAGLIYLFPWLVVALLPEKIAAIVANMQLTHRNHTK